MGDRSPRFGAFKRVDRTEIKMDRIIARTGLKKNDKMPLVAMVGGLPRPAPRAQKAIGVGSDCCDTTWVRQLVDTARSCQSMGNLPAGAPTPSCGPGAPSATQIAFPAVANVAAAASSQSSINVQVANFMGRRLLLPSAVASAVTINDVKVGTKSVFDSEEPIAGEMFSVDAQNAGSFLSFIPASAGMLITVYFTNVSNAAITFRGVIEGAQW